MLEAMTTFNNGPAHGVTLQLRNAPAFLRVTYNGKTYDALDQAVDEPTKEESISLYRLVVNRGSIHLNMGRGRGGFYMMADYAYVEEQPPDAVMRDGIKWVQWLRSKL